VTDFEAVQAMFRSVIEEWKHLDILVNNAGYAQPGLGPEMSVQDWEAHARRGPEGRVPLLHRRWRRT